MTETPLKHILEAALLAAGEPLTYERIQGLFGEAESPSREAIRSAAAELSADYAQRGIEVREVAGGFRIQVRADMAPWVSRLWDERPPRYSRAVLETLALIAYRQPITRGEIEQVRGVSVSTSIIRTLEDRGWVRVVGRREVPGRPALYATTRAFLEYFNLASLEDLPDLAALQDPEQAQRELERYLAGPGSADEAEDAGEAAPAEGEGPGDVAGDGARAGAGDDESEQQEDHGGEPRGE